MSERALAAPICPKRYGLSTIGVKKSTDCRSRPPPNGTYPASSRVSIPLTKPSAAAGTSPFSTCSRSPGANLEAQPAFCEYFVSLMRVFSFTGRLYPSPPFGTGPPPPDSDNAGLPSVTVFQLLYTLLLPRTQYMGPTPGLPVEGRRRLEPPLLRPNGDLPTQEPVIHVNWYEALASFPIRNGLAFPPNYVLWEVIKLT